MSEASDVFDHVIAEKRKNFPYVFKSYDAFYAKLSNGVNMSEGMTPRVIDAILKVAYTAGFKDGMMHVIKKAKPKGVE